MIHEGFFQSESYVPHTYQRLTILLVSTLLLFKIQCPKRVFSSVQKTISVFFACCKILLKIMIFTLNSFFLNGVNIAIIASQNEMLNASNTGNTISPEIMSVYGYTFQNAHLQQRFHNSIFTAMLALAIQHKFCQLQ